MAIAPFAPLDSDQQIIDLLYRRYFPELKAAAERHVKDPHLAEDLAHEVFASIAEHGNLADIKNRRAYVHTAMEYLRGEVDRLKNSEEEVIAMNSSRAWHAARFPVTHPPGMSDAECAAELVRLVERLTGHCAEVFQLSYAGHQTAQIALLLGIPKEAVEKYLLQARVEISAAMKLSE